VVAAQHERNSAGRDHLADSALDRGARPRGIGGKYRRVAVVDYAQLGHRVDLRLEVLTGRTAGCPDRARPEARSRPVGDEIVGGRADDCDVEALELGRILRVRQRRERQHPRVIGFLAVLAAALERVDHGRSVSSRSRKSLDGFAKRIVEKLGAPDAKAVRMVERGSADGVAGLRSQRLKGQLAARYPFPDTPLGRIGHPRLLESRVRLPRQHFRGPLVVRTSI
jgi:hypothetical protein